MCCACSSVDGSKRGAIGCRGLHVTGCGAHQRDRRGISWPEVRISPRRELPWRGPQHGYIGELGVHWSPFLPRDPPVDVVFQRCRDQAGGLPGIVLGCRCSLLDRGLSVHPPGYSSENALPETSGPEGMLEFEWGLGGRVDERFAHREITSDARTNAGASRQRVILEQSERACVISVTL